MALSEEDNVFAFFNFDFGFLLEECQDTEKKRFDDLGSEKGEDVVNLLPNDPFGMEFNMEISNDPIVMDFNLGLPRDPFGMDFDIETTFAAITGWMEDLRLKAYVLESDEGVSDGYGNGSGNLKSTEDNEIDDSKFIAGLNFVNFVWTSSMEYENEDRGNDAVNVVPMNYMENESYECTMLGECCTDDDLICFGCEKYGFERVKDKSDVAVDMIVFVIQYLNLGVKDLLTVERICRSLRDVVQKDPYLWTSIHIDDDLSRNITNDDLLWLTDRAQGKLCCLSLLSCLKITVDGLKQVLIRNLELTKLSVAGSNKLKSETLLQHLKDYNLVASPGIKRLRIGGLDLKIDHLKEYKLLLGEDEDASSIIYKPRFYRSQYLSLDNERAIDIEACPRCQKVGQVYDCPTENCQARIHSTKPCRGCIFCIARCKHCGCCLEDKAYHETFSFDYLCFDCFGEFIFEEGAILSPRQTYICQIVLYS